MAVTQLGYIGLNVTDIAAWETLAREVLGFQVRRRATGEPLYFRVDERHHRFALVESASESIAYFGWETRHAKDFEEMVRRVEAAGRKVKRGDAAGRALRHVEDYAAFADPNGFPLELFWGAEADPEPLFPGRPISGFRTGDLGLGHAVLSCDDPQANVAFYRDVLGLRLSDTIDFKGMELTFFHCNGRHHSVAFAGTRPGIAGGQISHFMVELNAMDDVGRAYDLCRERDIPIWMALGQHTNDRMLSFYLRSPSGFAIEYGYGGRVVDDETWEVQRWKAASLWGHQLMKAPA